MAGTKWTKEQQQAISEAGKNLLVAAAAGAGKTAVLVERIIKKIIDEKSGIDIDSLLVVTFTNAAAAEMRERIGEAIASELEKNPENVRLLRQMTLLGKASITTIHSFCLDVIRNNFHCLDIDPDFRIGDDTECTLLKQEVLEQVFEEIYEEDTMSGGFIQLLESYGGNRSDSSIQEMVLRLYSFTQSCPWPKKWLLDKLQLCKAGSCEEFAQTSHGRMLIELASIELEGIMDMVHEAKKLAESADGLEKYLETILSDEACLTPLSKLMENGQNWDSMVEGFSCVELDKLGRCGKNADKDMQDRVKKTREEYKKALAGIKEQYFTLPTKDIMGEIEHLYPALEALVNLTIKFSDRYSEEKRAKSMLDFNDLEHMCLKILLTEDEEGNLNPSETAMALKEKYTEILVDEYQDSNEVQEVMLTAVSRADLGKSNMFMVGDVKQSIYRFRQARPDLFMNKYNSYTSESGSGSMKIQLFKNFRSRKTVVDAVNFIFKQIMSVNVGELDYTDEEALNPGAVFKDNENSALYTGGETELHVIDTASQGASAGVSVNASEGGSAGDEETASGSEQEEPDEANGEGEYKGPQEVDAEELDSIQAEAQLVAGRIRELMEENSEGKRFGVYDKTLDTYRPVTYKDIVILLRTTSNWAETFVETLAMNGIPAYADTGTGYFRTVEIQIILSLLQIIDNPLQDIPLLSVLRSPIGGFDDEELARIRLLEKEGPFYYALRKAEDSSTDLGIKAREFTGKLTGWTEQALYKAVDELIWQLYSETGYYSFVGTMAGGEQRLGNLRLLFERARQFEKSSYKGLFNFINFINKMKESSGDLGTAKTLSENENVVRIMSIHKSKGLEFPVCFVSGCGKKFNMQDLNDKVLLHHEMGFGPEFTDVDKRIAYPTVQKQALKAKIRLETISEEMRILYVAFTRAREKLIITGSVRGFGKTILKWAGRAVSKGDKLQEYAMLKAGSYFDWIVPSVLRHKSFPDLRDYCNEQGSFVGTLFDDESKWSFCKWDKAELGSRKTTSTEVPEVDFAALLESEPDKKLYDEIDRRLGFTYGHKKVEGLESKFTVTELKRRFQELEGRSILKDDFTQMVKRPSFLEEKKGFSAAEKGTIQHFVMQHIDFNMESTTDTIKAKLEDMVSRVLLTREQAETVNINTIITFLNSDLSGRMRRAVSLYRETPFNLQIKPEELGYSDAADEMILLQGIIDCYFIEEDGNAVIVDYKTDWVKKDARTLAKERYSLQLEMYKRALESIEGVKVKEVYVYFFETGEMVDMQGV